MLLQVNKISLNKRDFDFAYVHGSFSIVTEDS